MVPCEKSKMVFIDSAIMKSIVVFSARPKFPARLISCIAYVSESSAYYLLKSIAINL